MKKCIMGFFILFGLLINGFSQDFYDINTINTVELIFEESNWDYILDSLKADGNEERHLGTAIVNGIQYDSVGIRYKGNSSYNANQVKNPFNIKLDYMIDDQEHENYGTLKLANVYKDPSFVREVLSYEIAGQYLPSSKANFMKVTVNGTYLGLYTSVQDVDKYFARSHFFSSDNPFFKGELTSGGAPTAGEIWGYYGPDSADYHNYFEIESDTGWNELISFLDTLNNHNSEVENVLNVDRHLWMLAFDILMVNLDAPVNFGHNYYLYQDDAGQFNPILWDLNESFGVFSMLLSNPGPMNVSDMQQLDPFLNSTHPDYPIINKILSIDRYKKMYVAHMKTIINEYFTSGEYRTRALEIQSIIDTEVQNDPNKFYTHEDFSENIDNSVGGDGPPGPGNQSIVGITELMDGRITFLNSQSEFSAAAPAISEISYSPAAVSANSIVWITVEATDADLVELAYRSSVSEPFEKVEMLDDGSHNDGEAGDGVYGVSITTGTTDLQYFLYTENDEAASFSPEQAACEFYSISISGDVVINEFMADNDNVVSDQDGEYDDWIELYNNSDSDKPLNGFFLTDDGDDLTQWTFPDTFIAAHSYLIIWTDNDEEQEGLHTNFKLSSSGEAIYLLDADTTIINEVTFGEQTQDLSTGRYPNGTGEFIEMTPSFSAENNDGSTGIDDNPSELLQEFILKQNYPNPFNPATTIEFSITETQKVTLKIYNILGEHVSTLVNNQLSGGNHQFQWNAEKFPSGIYFYVLQAGNYSETRKMMLVK